MKKKQRRYHPISKEITQLRQERGETQEQFARHFAVGRTTICMWEQYGPSPLKLVRAHIANVMKKLRRRKVR